LVINVQLDCQYPPVCAAGTGVGEDTGNSEEMGSTWGSSPNNNAPEVASSLANNNNPRGDFAHVLLSPRVGGGNTPLHPMSRRALSAKRMPVPEPFLKLFKTSASANTSPSKDGGGDGSTFESLLRGDSKKMPKKEHGFMTRLVEYVGGLNSSRDFPASCTKRNWRHSAFFLSALLVFTFLLVKVLSAAWLGVEQQTSSITKVPILKSSFLLLNCANLASMLSTYI
jgi:hypothetical protein